MKILFDHLQKTGGTALLAFLSSRFDGYEAAPLILHENIRFAAGLLGVVGGHLELARDYDWDGGIYHVTVLRDPIERFLSHYSYAREQADAADPFAILACCHDIGALLRLEHLEVIRTVRDFYIRHFAEAFEPPAPATPAALFAAMEQRYRLIGISERMNDVGRILCLALGSEPAPVAPCRTTELRLRQADLDPDTLTLLRKLTAGDRALYQCR